MHKKSFFILIILLASSALAYYFFTQKHTTAPAQHIHFTHESRIALFADAATVILHPTMGENKLEITYEDQKNCYFSHATPKDQRRAPVVSIQTKQGHPTCNVILDLHLNTEIAQGENPSKAPYIAPEIHLNGGTVKILKGTFMESLTLAGKGLSLEVNGYIPEMRIGTQAIQATFNVLPTKTTLDAKALHLTLEGTEASDADMKINGKAGHVIINNAPAINVTNKLKSKNQHIMGNPGNPAANDPLLLRGTIDNLTLTYR